MKELYIRPEITIIEFETEDVITTSSTNAESQSDEIISFPIIPLN